MVKSHEVESSAKIKSFSRKFSLVESHSVESLDRLKVIH